MQLRKRARRTSREHDLTADPHSAFGSDNAKLIYALTSRGDLLKIDQKARMVDRPLTCPGCNSRVTTVRPQVGTHHYRHMPGSRAASGCGGGVETVAHLLAKAVLEQERWIWTPPVDVLDNGRARTIVSGQRLAFDTIRVEPWLDGRRPDLSVTRRGYNGEIEVFWIEVQVTNPCSEEKLKDIMARGISTLQVVVPDPRQGEAAFREALLSTSEREWLFNRRAAEWKVDRTSSLLARARQVLGAAEHGYDGLVPDEARQAEATLIDLGFGGWIGLDVKETPGFRTPPRAWQAMLVERLVIAPIRDGSSPSPITLKGCFPNLKPYLHPPLRETFAPDMLEALKVANGAPFRTPIAVLGRYLDQLVANRVLEKHSSAATWHVPATVIADVESRLSRSRIISDRLTKLQLKIEALLEDVPHAFDLEAWLDRPVLNDLSPRAYARSDQATWGIFCAALAQIERMKTMAAPAENLLGLPLDDLLADTIVTARQALQEARLADERAATLERRALALVGATAAKQWLATPLLRGVAPSVRARESDSALERMLILLDRHAQELRHLAHLRTKADRRPVAMARRALGRIKSFLPPRAWL